MKLISIADSYDHKRDFKDELTAFVVHAETSSGWTLKLHSRVMRDVRAKTTHQRGLSRIIFRMIRWDRYHTHHIHKSVLPENKQTLRLIR